MNINKSDVQNNTLLFLIRKSKSQVNISDISDILGMSYLFVKNELIHNEYFPRPIVYADLPLSKKWLLYDVLVWALKQK